MLKAAQFSELFEKWANGDPDSFQPLLNAAKAHTLRLYPHLVDDERAEEAAQQTLQYMLNRRISYQHLAYFKKAVRGTAANSFAFEKGARDFRQLKRGMRSTSLEGLLTSREGEEIEQDRTHYELLQTESSENSSQEGILLHDILARLSPNAQALLLLQQNEPGADPVAKLGISTGTITDLKREIRGAAAEASNFALHGEKAYYENRGITIEYGKNWYRYDDHIRFLPPASLFALRKLLEATGPLSYKEFLQNKGITADTAIQHLRRVRKSLPIGATILQVPAPKGASLDHRYVLFFKPDANVSIEAQKFSTDSHEGMPHYQQFVRDRTQRGARIKASKQGMKIASELITANKLTAGLDGETFNMDGIDKPITVQVGYNWFLVDGKFIRMQPRLIPGLKRLLTAVSPLRGPEIFPESKSPATLLNYMKTLISTISPAFKTVCVSGPKIDKHQHFTYFLHHPQRRFSGEEPFGDLILNRRWNYIRAPEGTKTLLALHEQRKVALQLADKTGEGPKHPIEIAKRDENPHYTQQKLSTLDLDLLKTFNTTISYTAKNKSRYGLPRRCSRK